MKKLLPCAALLLATACQPATPPTAATADLPTVPLATTTEGTAPTPGAPTAEAARAAVARYISALPQAALYVPDSARVVDVDTRWQVLVPRTDWAKRMPNRAAFEVDKATGAVTTRPVK